MSFSGITGIGYNPSFLGTYGLGTGSSYASYADPMMMGMMTPYSMGGMGMMGMYNPTFMAQMAQMTQDLEKMQLNHTSAMHQLQLQNKTQAFVEHDRAIFEKAMVDAGVNDGITLLAKKIREGDTKGICEEYDKLETTLYQKYADYFEANKDKISPSVSVRNFITMLYGKIASAQYGEIVDLRQDMKKYGETAFEHGFWKRLHGKDYHDEYTEQAISRIFGTNIDNRAGKERMQKAGGYAQAGVEGAAALVAGAVAVPTTLSIGKGLLKWATPDRIAKKLPKVSVCNSKVAAWGAIATLAADIWWQTTRA